MAIPVYDPLSFIENPYPIYRGLRDQAPVYCNEDRQIWALSRYEDVRAAARDWRRFSSKDGIDLDDFQIGPGSFLDCDPPRHDELRTVLGHDMYAKGVKHFEERIRARVKWLLARLVGKERVDFAKEFAKPLPASVMCDVLGFPIEDLAQLQEWFEGMFERTPGALAVPERAWRAKNEMRTYIEQAVIDRRANPKDDLLSRLARAEREKRLTMEEVDGMTRLLFVAGVHTTSALISNSLLLLEPYPDTRRAFAVDPEAGARTIDELLRYDAPVQSVARTLLDDVDLHGQRIPEGARLLLLLGSANRDERKFDNPDSLNFGRPLVRHLSFGEGIHFCFGAWLARLETRVAFEELFSKLDDYEVTAPVERHFTFHERGVASLQAKIAQWAESPAVMRMA